MNNPYSAEQIYGFCEQHWPETHNVPHHYVLYLHRLVQLETQSSDQVMKQHGLSGAEFDILATLRRAEPPHILSPTALQRSTLLSSGGQTKLLYQLEAKGLIERSINPNDKRSKFVHLNTKGQALVEIVMSETLERLRGLFDQAGLKKKEVKQLISLMGQLLSVLEENN
ncbi:MAG: MarR family transcriptional regulator [Pseudomonadales bacterium]|nr:MarR family transcriptional regulator [Pseudomonadales bacterium]